MNLWLSQGVFIGYLAVVILVALELIRWSNVFRYIPNNQVGIVEKLWAAKGSIKSGFIALHGEAGFEPGDPARRHPSSSFPSLTASTNPTS